MKLIFLFFLLFTCVATKAQQESVILKLNLNKGDTLECTYMVLDTIEYKFPALSLIFGSNQKGKEERIDKMKMAVCGLDSNGNYILRSEYIQQIIKSKIPGIGDIEYNSDSIYSDKEVFMPSYDDIYKAQFAAYLHHPFTIIISSSGQCISVTGIEGIVDAFVNQINNAPHLSANQKNANIENIRKNVSNESIRRALNSLFDVYADTPVVIGSKWEKEIITDVYEPEDEIYHYQLQNISGDSIFIDVNARVNAAGDTAKNGTATRMIGTISGTVIIEKNSGIILQKLMYEKTQGTTVENGKALKVKSSSLRKLIIAKKP